MGNRLPRLRARQIPSRPPHGPERASSAPVKLAEELVVLESKRLDEDDESLETDDEKIAQEEEEHFEDRSSRDVVHHVRKHEDRKGKPHVVQCKRGESNEGRRIAQKGEQAVKYLEDVHHRGFFHLGTPSLQQRPCENVPQENHEKQDEQKRSPDPLRKGQRGSGKRAEGHERRRPVEDQSGKALTVEEQPAEIPLSVAGHHVEEHPRVTKPTLRLEKA